jgi:hypothetical protein
LAIATACSSITSLSSREGPSSNSRHAEWHPWYDKSVELPWVGHRSRNWEPEPLRWLGVRGMGKSTTSPIAAVADTIAGRS